MLPAWVYLVLAFAWLLLLRARWKRRGSHLNSSISAGALRDMTGRGGF